MPTHILIAPPAAGKTRAAVARVQAALREKPFARVWVVLPENLQIAAFQNRLAETGGALGVQVGTFQSLYRALLQEAGQAYPAVPRPLADRLVGAAIAEVHARGQLPHYAAIRHTPGFVRELRTRFAELKRALIFPEKLVEKDPGQAKPAKPSWPQVYLEYQTRLRAAGWADLEGYGWLAIEALQADTELAAGWDLLVADGFDDFTRTQLQTFELLAKRVNELLITLPGTPAMDRTAHRRFRRGLEALQKSLPEAVLFESGERIPPQPAPLQRAEYAPPRTPSPRLPQALAALEAGLFERAEADPPRPDSPPRQAASPQQPLSLQLLEARSPAEEAREALRWLKARVLQDGIPLTQCALVVPDLERYRPFLQAAGAEFGVPLRFPHGEPLNRTPAIQALLNLLSLPLQDYPRRALLAVLGSPFLDTHSLGFPPAALQALENASRHARVVGGLDQWRAALTRLAALTETPVDPDRDRTLPDLPVGEAAQTLAAGLEALAARLQPPGPQPLTGWVAWLENLLETFGFLEADDSPTSQEILGAFREALRALVLGERLLGAVTLDHASFISQLGSALTGPVPEPQGARITPAVRVLGLLDVRGLRYQAVAALGLAEGVTPEIERPDPFFDEAARLDLRLEPRLGREQAGLFYQLVTRADRILLLTRPYLTESGEEWEPSSFWQAVRKAVDIEPERISPEALRPLPDAASSQELLFWAVRGAVTHGTGLPAQFKALEPRWAQLRQARTVLTARTAPRPRSPYEGDLSSVPGFEQTYGPEYTWSASALETYGTCPHRFYVERVLQLAPRQEPELGLDALILGGLLHRVLEMTYRSAQDPTDLDAALEALRSAAPMLLEGAPERYGFRPGPLWEAEKAQLAAQLEDTVRALGEISLGWQPVGFEISFRAARRPRPGDRVRGRPGAAEWSDRSAGCQRRRRAAGGGLQDGLERIVPTRI